jgi:S-DNA-T family DNA segregation ATPase FtsK/SpoIIIE
MATKKKKPARRPVKKKGKKSAFKSPEIIAIFLFLVAAFILVSLVTYHADDPSWASAAEGQKIRNLCGRVGASLAEWFFQLLGLAAFVLPLSLIYLGVWTLRADGEIHYGSKSLGLLFLLLILSALFSLFFQPVSWRSGDFPAGGLVGHLISSFFVRYLNHAGTFLLLLGFLVLTILFATHLSLKKLGASFSRLFQTSFKNVRIRITHHKKEKSREKARQKVLEKYAAAKQREKPVKAKKAAPAAEEKPPAPKARPRKEKKAVITEPPKSPPPPADYLFPEMDKKEGYEFPPFDLLDWGKQAEKIDKDELFQKKHIIEDKLRQFHVLGEVKEYHPGPIITTYEFFPDPGIKVSQVANLSEEVSLALEAISVRIQRIPGKSSLGIEVPNNTQEIIKIRDVIQSEKFLESKSKLTVALGKTVHGEVYTTDLTNMPHLLIAGATGTGKSVCLSALIASILYKATPDEVKLILIDPKRLEFSTFEGIPHLMCPVVKDPRKAEGILLDAIKKMDARYKKMALLNVRNIQQYNQMVKRLLKEGKNLTEEEREDLKPLPYIVIIIDELAELMMIGAKEVEYCIARLAQLARAVGIHLVMATQRPSTDVITGTIKNNFPSRIAFRVPTKIDARIILDSQGAEKLLGNGDLLFMPPNFPRITRLHGSYISLQEINRVVDFVKGQAQPEYDERIISVLKGKPVQADEEGQDEEKDPMFEKAVELVLLTGQASASYLQRRLRLGYARAARIIDQMEQEGILGPSEGSKAREILVDPQTYLKTLESDGE